MNTTLDTMLFKFSLGYSGFPFLFTNTISPPFYQAAGYSKVSSIEEFLNNSTLPFFIANVG